jgi:putative Holliday junction resolvase
MDGSEGKTTEMVKEFAQKIAKSINLPYAFWDERLSSRAVENFLIKEIDMSRSKRKETLDSSAAAYILQGVLDSLTYL